MGNKMYEYAKEQYAKLGVDTDVAIEKLENIAISLHCWQGDDVRGFENPDGDLTGGIQATGNYPGKARTIEELRMDLEKTYSMIPGNHRLNLHASYGDFSEGKADRDEIEPKHYKSWVEWAKKNNLGIDFNPTCYSHPKSDDGLTLSHPDEKIRNFWIEHCKRARKIGEYIGKELGKPCVTNVWIPDGFKDTPVDRLGPRKRLNDSLDQIFQEKINPEYNLDAVECKLFGIGSESYVVGSHEFYMGYAVKNNTLLTLDAGHFHPTEVISNKISSALLFADQLLLHVSRPVRWDSDHVVTFDDELKEIAHEIIRNDFVDRVHIGLDFFDASINRIAAWVIGTRNMQKALLYALLEPTEMLIEKENELDFTTRLYMLEDLKTYPFGIVWDYFLEKNGKKASVECLEDIRQYEKDILSKRA